MQQAPVSDLIFDVPALIAYLSTFMILAPGDVIVTGTTGGVGAYRTPRCGCATAIRWTSRSARSES